MTESLPHITKSLDSSRRPWRPHPLRSLAYSAALHATLAIVLMLIPSGVSQRGTQRPRSVRSSAVLKFTPSPTPVEWNESIERLDEVAALEPQVELPELDSEPILTHDDFFDEPLRDEGRRAVPVPVDRSVFDDLPDDLFVEPTAALEPPAAEPQTAEPETTPAEPEEVEPEPVEPPVEAADPPTDADPADETSEESPETEGEVEDADTSGAGEAESPLLEAPAPRYPPSARAQGKQGTVWLAVDVDAAGRVIQVRIKTSSGHRVLDEAARQAVLDRWRFRPRRDGEPEVRRYLEPVTFQLRAR